MKVEDIDLTLQPIERIPARREWPAPLPRVATPPQATWGTLRRCARRSRLRGAMWKARKGVLI